MLRHAATLGMLITSGLIFALGSAGPMTLVGLAMLGVGLGIEIAAWGRVARVHRAHSDQWLGITACSAGRCPRLRAIDRVESGA